MILQALLYQIFNIFWISDIHFRNATIRTSNALLIANSRAQSCLIEYKINIYIYIYISFLNRSKWFSSVVRRRFSQITNIDQSIDNYFLMLIWESPADPEQQPTRIQKLTNIHLV